MSYAKHLKSVGLLNANIAVRGPYSENTPAYTEMVCDIGTLRITSWTGADLATGVQALATALTILANDLRALSPVIPIDDL